MARFSSIALALLVLVAGCGQSGATDAGPVDMGTATPDVGVDAALPALDAFVSADAGHDAFVAPDTSVDAGPIACDETHIHFVPSGGHLAVGQLCDDVFVCPADAAEAARVMGIGFECSATPEGGCTGTTCVLRPSTLDATEVQQICAVISVSSPPETSCVVYL